MTEDNPLGTIHINPDTIIKCIKFNDTIGIDDRVVRLFKPFGGDVNTDVRTAFKGSERYSNPEQAPVHISPGKFIDDEQFRSPPERYEVDTDALGIPNIVDDRTDEEQEAFNKAYSEVIDVWERDIRGSLVDQLVIEPVYPHDERLVFDVEYES